MVVGVDISSGMLDQAAKAIMAAGLSNIKLVQGDAEALDYPAASFDLIICGNALPYMTDVPAALRHWHSLLKPGGRLAFNCWAEQSYVTGHLLREIAGRHGIRVAVIGRDTGTPAPLPKHSRRCWVRCDKGRSRAHEHFFLGRPIGRCLGVGGDESALRNHAERRDPHKGTSGRVCCRNAVLNRSTSH